MDMLNSWEQSSMREGSDPIQYHYADPSLPRIPRNPNNIYCTPIRRKNPLFYEEHSYTQNVRVYDESSYEFYPYVREGGMSDYSHYPMNPLPSNPREMIVPLQLNKSLSKNLLPGETNPDAAQGEHLCYEYLRTGECSRQMEGHVCKYRHLIPIHPEAIAYRFRVGLLSNDEIIRYQLRPCEENETNPFAPLNAPLCKDFLNHKVCERTKNMKICRYRHVLPQHPLAIEDRERRKRERQ